MSWEENEFEDEFGDEDEDEDAAFTFDYTDHMRKLQLFISEELGVTLDFSRYFLRAILGDISPENYEEWVYTVTAFHDEIINGIAAGDIITGINSEGEITYSRPDTVSNEGENTDD